MPRRYAGQPIAHRRLASRRLRIRRPVDGAAAGIDAAELPAWVAAHPDGLIVSFYRRFRFRAEPIYSQPFRGVEVSIWNARDALASGVDPNASHARDDGDDTNDDD